MNLLFERMPDAFVVDGKRYPIKTDFRYWMQINEAILGHSEFDLGALIDGLFLNESPPTDEKSIESLTFQIGNFLRCGEHSESKRDDGRVTFSYSADSDYIISAFQEFYNIDLITAEMHWWKFNLLLRSMSSDSELKERIRFRNIKLSDIKDPKERKRIRKIQKMIALPVEPMTDEDIGGSLW